jgi:hypothetical protein
MLLPAPSAAGEVCVFIMNKKLKIRSVKNCAMVTANVRFFEYTYLIKITNKLLINLKKNNFMI